MSQEKVVREITITRLEKETSINFSEKSLDLISTLLDERDENKKSDEELVQALPLSSTSREIMKRVLSIYQEERNK